MIKYSSFHHYSVEVARFVVPVLVLLSVWIPLIVHYYVSESVITDEMINQGRMAPVDQIMEELEGFRFLRFGFKNDEEVVLAAERLLEKGEVKISGHPLLKIGMPFDVNDIDKVSPGQLMLAGFVVPDILLEAYNITRRDGFLLAARDVIEGWALYERNAWLPKGLLWNDHAIASRIEKLARFWWYYRNHPDYQPRVAKTIFHLVDRSAKLLAKPSHFTFNTTHGVIQNLALWHLCLAFPTLPCVEQYKQLALNRMREQINFLVSDEGVVLVHSSTYHKAGVRHIGKTLRLLTLLNQPIPEDFILKYQKAKHFYAQLRRPDGSMPKFGDSLNLPDPCGPFITNVNSHNQAEALDFKNDWVAQQPYSIFPVSGYSIWWDGLADWPHAKKISQAVVTWSYFPGYAHKHADEMSVLLWAKGQDWWTNIGYWPYGVRGRSEAVSWDGSNAPHLIDEDPKSLRNTRILHHGWLNKLSVIDLERSGPNDYRARRQVIYLKPNIWIVIDNTYGSEKNRTTTKWTTSHNIDIRKGKIPGSYLLEAEDKSSSLTTFFWGSSGTDIKQYRGSYTPFAGWEVIGGIRIKPTHAIVIEQPVNNSWCVALWLLEDNTAPNIKIRDYPNMVNWKGPEYWEITLPFEHNIMNVRRHGDKVTVSDDRGEKTEVLNLTEVNDFSSKLNKINNAYINATNKYPKFNTLIQKRFKLTKLLILLLVFQTIFFFIVKRSAERYYVYLAVLSLLCWAGVGIWIAMVYL